MSLDRERVTHVLQELGFAVTRVGEDLTGAARISQQMHVPGTAQLRTSILAAWTDLLAGLLAVQHVAPRVPVTLDLDIQLYRRAPATGSVNGITRVVKSGRSVFIARVEFTTSDGEPLATTTASFMTAPDPALRLPDNLSIDAPAPPDLLTMPLAERAGCQRTAAGVATLPKSDDGLNASRTINGGLIAVVVEEAALSLSPGDALCSLAVRYLRPARFGPVVATAEVSHGLGWVEVRDAGHDHRLSAVATTRAFGL